MGKCMCGHSCHCKGDCSSGECTCTHCLHTSITLEEAMKWIKKQWQKFIDWVFKGFYKD
jgi:hypothetical protein